MKTISKKRLLWGFAILMASIVIVCIICDYAVGESSKDKSYSEIKEIPHRKVGLVLGTSPISIWNGRRNYYFDNRIKAAAQLYKAGKVDWLVVSGGDYRKTENGYDEPVAMRDSLMKQGVDSARIVLDYDGTRTLNSIAKMRDVYRQDSIIIISQEYHNERALYQANKLGISAIAFNAGTPVGMRSPVWWRNRSREVLARVKLLWEMRTAPNILYRNTYSPSFVIPKPFPTPLRSNLLWDEDWTICHNQEAIVLTDSLKQRINKFVEFDTNYIVYRMDQLHCFSDGIDYDLIRIMDDGYSFSADDKMALKEFLYKNTAVYNEVGTRFRYVRHSGKWPY